MLGWSSLPERNGNGQKGGFNKSCKGNFISLILFLVEMKRCADSHINKWRESCSDPKTQYRAAYAVYDRLTWVHDEWYDMVITLESLVESLSTLEEEQERKSKSAMESRRSSNMKLLKPGPGLKDNIQTAWCWLKDDCYVHLVSPEAIILCIFKLLY